MSGTVLKTIITVVLIFHAVGQLMGILPVFHLFGTDTENPPKWAKSWSARSSLSGNLLGERGDRILCFVLYFAAFILFSAALCSLQGWAVPAGLWKSLAVAGAFVSLTAILLFWNGLIMLFPHKIGNIAVNILLIFAVMIKKWPPESLLK